MWLALIPLLLERAEALAAAGLDDQADLLRREASESARREAERAESEGAFEARIVLLVMAARGLEAGGEALIDEAVAAADRLVESDDAIPETAYAVRAEALGAAANLRVRKGDHGSAAEHFVSAADAAETAGIPRTAARLRLDAGRAFSRAGRPDLALASFESAERLAGEDRNLVAEARVSRARLLARRGDIDAARTLVEQIPAAAATEAWIAMAEGALEGGYAAQALPIYDRLIADGGARPRRARHGRARTRMALGDLDGAEADLRRLLELRPEPRQAAAAWTDLAALALRRGDRVAARERLERCLALDPEHAAARALMAALED